MKHQAKWYLILNILLGIYSLSGVFSKLAGWHSVTSPWFFVFYGVTLGLLVFYAFGWQQVIKHIPLTTAYANKAITVIWGILYGILFFGETLSKRQWIGAVVIIVGILIFVSSDAEESQ